MKKLFSAAFFVVSSLIFSCSCFAGTAEEFLKDMEAGQAARWALTDNASEEELSDMSFRYAYLDAELEYISKYADTEFDNEKFDELAHLYVSGVNLQREAVGFYDDYPYVFESEWTSGYMMRSYANVGLHDYYGLAIPEDKLTECRNYIASIGVEQTVSITEYGRALETEHLLDPESVEITPFNDEFDKLTVKVRNISETDMRDMHLTVNLLDAGGDILQNLLLYNTGILSSGQGVTVNATYQKNCVNAIEFMTVSYTKEDGTYVDNTLDGFGKMNVSSLVSVQSDEMIEQSDTTPVPEAQVAVSEPAEENGSPDVQSKETQSSDQDTPNIQPAASDQDASAAEKKSIERTVRARIDAEYANTNVDLITINSDYGTEDNPDDWVVLVYLTWNMNNSPETSKKVLKMYSDDLAALLWNKFRNVQEVAVFWKVPHLTENTSKWSYEREADGMYQTDNMLGW